MSSAKDKIVALWCPHPVSTIFLSFSPFPNNDSDCKHIFYWCIHASLLKTIVHDFSFTWACVLLAALFFALSLSLELLLSSLWLWDQVLWSWRLAALLLSQLGPVSVASSNFLRATLTPTCNIFLHLSLSWLILLLKRFVNVSDCKIACSW